MITMRYDELCVHVTATIVNTIEGGHAGWMIGIYRSITAGKPGSTTTGSA